MEQRMKALIFDTETTGFVQHNKPVNDPDQCHLVQLAAQLVDMNDPEGIIMQFSVIVNPGPGVNMSESAQNAHGISLEMAAEFGVTTSTAFDLFRHHAQFADQFVAHNADFDKRVMELAMERRTGEKGRFTKPFYCTMKEAKPVVRCPPTAKMVASGRTSYKNPSLTECMEHFFGEELSGAHDAMVDTNGCRRVFFELQKRKTK